MARALDFDHPDAQVSPRGLRLLSQIPRLPESVQEEVARHFGDFHKLLYASVDDLDKVSGVGQDESAATAPFLRSTDRSSRASRPLGD